ncbi:MAG: hypothetical protein V3R96_00445 [Dehalococcoidales bacterium]
MTPIVEHGLVVWEKKGVAPAVEIPKPDSKIAAELSETRWILMA